MIINLYWSQLRSGLSTSILENVDTDLRYLPSGRIMWLRDFLNRIGGRIICEYQLMQPRNCSNEKAIMDIVSQKQYSPEKMHSINTTREYLQVFWATDILDVHAKSFDPFVIFKSEHKASWSEYDWPRHPMPKPRDIRRWNNVMKSIARDLLETTDNKPFRWLNLSKRGRIWETNLTNNDGDMF